MIELILNNRAQFFNKELRSILKKRAILSYRHLVRLRGERMFIFYLTFFIIVVPICIILHEVCHGIGCVVSSKTNVHIYLGPASQDNKQTFRIGKFHFQLFGPMLVLLIWKDN